MTEAAIKFDAESVKSIVDHMNEDHADALVLYVDAYTDIDAESIENLHMLDLDSVGIRLGYTTANAPHEISISFQKALGKNLRSVSGARGALVAMVKLARQ